MLARQVEMKRDCIVGRIDPCSWTSQYAQLTSCENGLDGKTVRLIKDASCACSRMHQPSAALQRLPQAIYRTGARLQAEPWCKCYAVNCMRAWVF